MAVSLDFERRIAYLLVHDDLYLGLVKFQAAVRGSLTRQKLKTGQYPGISLKSVEAARKRTHEIRQRSQENTKLNSLVASRTLDQPAKTPSVSSWPVDFETHYQSPIPLQQYHQTQQTQPTKQHKSTTGTKRKSPNKYLSNKLKQRQLANTSKLDQQLNNTEKSIKTPHSPSKEYEAELRRKWEEEERQKEEIRERRKKEEREKKRLEEEEKRKAHQLRLEEEERMKNETKRKLILEQEEARLSKLEADRLREEMKRLTQRQLEEERKQKEEDERMRRIQEKRRREEQEIQELEQRTRELRKMEEMRLMELEERLLQERIRDEEQLRKEEERLRNIQMEEKERAERNRLREKAIQEEQIKWAEDMKARTRKLNEEAEKWNREKREREQRLQKQDGLVIGKNGDAKKSLPSTIHDKPYNTTQGTETYLSPVMTADRLALVLPKISSPASIVRSPEAEYSLLIERQLAAKKELEQERQRKEQLERHLMELKQLQHERVKLIRSREEELLRQRQEAEAILAQERLKAADRARKEEEERFQERERARLRDEQAFSSYKQQQMSELNEFQRKCKEAEDLLEQERKQRLELLTLEEEKNRKERMNRRKLEEERFEAWKYQQIMEIQEFEKQCQHAEQMLLDETMRLMGGSRIEEDTLRRLKNRQNYYNEDLDEEPIAGFTNQKQHIIADEDYDASEMEDLRRLGFNSFPVRQTIQVWTAAIAPFPTIPTSTSKDFKTRSLIHEDEKRLQNWEENMNEKRKLLFKQKTGNPSYRGVSDSTLDWTKFHNLLSLSKSHTFEPIKQVIAKSSPQFRKLSQMDNGYEAPSVTDPFPQVYDTNELKQVVQEAVPTSDALAVLLAAMEVNDGKTTMEGLLRKQNMVNAKNYMTSLDNISPQKEETSDPVPMDAWSLAHQMEKEYYVKHNEPKKPIDTYYEEDTRIRPMRPTPQQQQQQQQNEKEAVVHPNVVRDISTPIIINKRPFEPVITPQISNSYIPQSITNPVLPTTSLLNPVQLAQKLELEYINDILQRQESAELDSRNAIKQQEKDARASMKLLESDHRRPIENANKARQQKLLEIAAAQRALEEQRAMLAQMIQQKQMEQEMANQNAKRKAEMEAALKKSHKEQRQELERQETQLRSEKRLLEKRLRDELEVETKRIALELEQQENYLKQMKEEEFETKKEHEKQIRIQKERIKKEREAQEKEIEDERREYAQRIAELENRAKEAERMRDRTKEELLETEKLKMAAAEIAHRKELEKIKQVALEIAKIEAQLQTLQERENEKRNEMLEKESKNRNKVKTEMENNKPVAQVKISVPHEVEEDIAPPSETAPVITDPIQLALIKQAEEETVQLMNGFTDEQFQHAHRLLELKRRAELDEEFRKEAHIKLQQSEMRRREAEARREAAHQLTEQQHKKYLAELKEAQERVGPYSNIKKLMSMTRNDSANSALGLVFQEMDDEEIADIEANLPEFDIHKYEERERLRDEAEQGRIKADLDRSNAESKRQQNDELRDDLVRNIQRKLDQRYQQELMEMDIEDEEQYKFQQKLKEKEMERERLAREVAQRAREIMEMEEEFKAAKDDETVQWNIAENRIQNWFRGEVEFERQDQLKDKIADENATKIQSIYRSYQAKNEVENRKKMMVEQSQALKEAAEIAKRIAAEAEQNRLLQEAERAAIIKRHRDKAATKIQSNWRGLMARRHFADRRLELEMARARRVLKKATQERQNKISIQERDLINHLDNAQGPHDESDALVKHRDKLLEEEQELMRQLEMLGGAPPKLDPIRFDPNMSSSSSPGRKKKKKRSQPTIDAAHGHSNSMSADEDAAAHEAAVDNDINKSKQQHYILPAVKRTLGFERKAHGAPYGKPFVKKTNFLAQGPKPYKNQSGKTPTQYPDPNAYQADLVNLFADASRVMDKKNPFMVDPAFMNESLYEAVSGAAALKTIQEMRIRAEDLARKRPSPAPALVATAV